MGLAHLSAIDILWPGHIPQLVPHLDELGYRRFWTTEHHSPAQSASPTLLAAVAAGLCERMRVGTAGVMVGARAPVQIAEDFRLLELLYPGRVDLGVIGALPRGDVRSALLDGRSEGVRGRYPERVAEILRCLHPESGEREAGPLCSSAPQLWVCGTSSASAQLAARLGCGFAYHHHLAEPGESAVDGPGRIREYRHAFVPNAHRSTSEAVVVAYGMCAETGAAESWFPAIGLPPDFIGPPSACVDRLTELADSYCVSELVIQSVSMDLDARMRSYRLISEALGIKASGPMPATKVARG